MIKFADIRNKALKLGIKTGRLSKKDIIHKIQIKEGNDPCFNSGRSNCEHLMCCWREICIKPN